MRRTAFSPLRSRRTSASITRFRKRVNELVRRVVGVVARSAVFFFRLAERLRRCLRRAARVSISVRRVAEQTLGQRSVCFGILPILRIYAGTYVDGAFESSDDRRDAPPRRDDDEQKKSRRALRLRAGPDAMTVACMSDETRVTRVTVARRRPSFVRAFDFESEKTSLSPGLSIVAVGARSSARGPSWGRTTASRGNASPSSFCSRVV